MSFTWVPFYREVAARVLEYENEQGELLAILREMKAAGLPTVPLEHDKPTLTPLTTIDPFTFMANFGRNLETSNYAICQWMREKWQLKTPTPTDFSGRHGVQANYRGSWFFGSLAERIPNDTDYLWQLAKQAYDGEVDSVDVALVAQCLSWPNLQMKKLSMGLSWINPEEFLPLSGAVLRYAQDCGMNFRQSALLNGDLDEYRAFMDAAHQINPSHVAFVKAAYQTQTDDDVEEDEVTAMPDFPLNQILYGPPGTGKTYGTIEHAVKIIDGVAARSHVEAKVRFDELRANGQIEFVTFHQSFSYEEFIEGLRPILDEDGEGTARYEVRDGVLKTLALRATEHEFLHVQYPIIGFEDAWTNLLAKLDDDPNFTVGWVNDNARFLVSKKGNEIAVVSKDGRIRCNCDRRIMEHLWREIPTGSPINNSLISQIALSANFQCFPNFTNALLSEMRKWSLGDRRIQQRYVLIVDEINRGNISKILGELITLLEPDKRIGADNELRVQLPVSGDQFALPPNLYLLGTMNTADKSLALLDVALRRRFDFIEMAPDNSLFPSFARDVLTQLNLRLEAALDREHRIGHAVFIGCDESQFNEVFRKKIIPLLQEFFYNDWETLRAVLGESGDNGAFIKKLVAPSGMKARTKWRWWFDEEDAGTFDILGTLRTNYGLWA